MNWEEEGVKTKAEKQQKRGGWGAVSKVSTTDLSQVPWAHSVVQPPCPQLGALRWDVYAAGPIRVTLELSAHKNLYI